MQHAHTFSRSVFGEGLRLSMRKKDILTNPRLEAVTIS